jgi:hypothetical protein
MGGIWYSLAKENFRQSKKKREKRTELVEERLGQDLDSLADSLGGKAHEASAHVDNWSNHCELTAADRALTATVGATSTDANPAVQTEGTSDKKDKASDKGILSTEVICGRGFSCLIINHTNKQPELLPDSSQ